MADDRQIDRKTLIGRSLPPVSFALKQDVVREFNLIVGETDAVYTDRTVARKAGYNDCVVPPSYTQLVALALIRSLDWDVDLKLDWNVATAMYGEQDLRYFRPLYYGETLEVTSYISNVERKRGRRVFDVVSIDLRVEGDPGETVMEGQIQLLIFD